MKVEATAAAAHAEMLDLIVPTLEGMRHEMKALLLETQSAMLEAGLPKRRKPDKEIPFYYGTNSWQNQGDCPWNEAERRALTPAEGIRVLMAQRDEARAEAKAAKAAVAVPGKRKARSAVGYEE